MFQDRVFFLVFLDILYHFFKSSLILVFSLLLFKSSSILFALSFITSHRPFVHPYFNVSQILCLSFLCSIL
nr:MAG TPA: hypothetical protein [Bacteriophage sp.]